jgi:hypothetical protein
VVNNDPFSLIAENAWLNDLLDNHDDVLRKTNKEKREYRSLLEEAKEKVVELESLLDDACRFWSLVFLQGFSVESKTSGISSSSTLCQDLEAPYKSCNEANLTPRSQGLNPRR